jgi:hypothetical protein
VAWHGMACEQSRAGGEVFPIRITCGDMDLTNQWPAYNGVTPILG